jgi:hypothetical protein
MGPEVLRVSVWALAPLEVAVSQDGHVPVSVSVPAGQVASSAVDDHVAPDDGVVEWVT